MLFYNHKTFTVNFGRFRTSNPWDKIWGVSRGVYRYIFEPYISAVDRKFDYFFVEDGVFLYLMFIEKLVIFTSELGYLLINSDGIVSSKLSEIPIVLA